MKELSSQTLNKILKITFGTYFGLWPLDNGLNKMVQLISLPDLINLLHFLDYTYWLLLT